MRWSGQFSCLQCFPVLTDKVHIIFLTSLYLVQTDHNSYDRSQQLWKTTTVMTDPNRQIMTHHNSYDWSQQLWQITKARPIITVMTDHNSYDRSWQLWQITTVMTINFVAVGFTWQLQTTFTCYIHTTWANIIIGQTWN